MTKPFLKWAGNKYRIMDHLLRLLPPGNCLIEPFLGSAAVFLNTDYPRYHLSDANPDLIQLFKLIKKEGRSFIHFCESFFTPKNNDRKIYYDYRSLFNETEDARLKSALFLYLNKHGYNGLCRYNSQIKFNVPFGDYKKPYFPEKEMLYFHQKSKNAKIKCASFLDAMDNAKKGDVIYCDPPYVPLSKTASFTRYHSHDFQEEQQRLLADKAEDVASRGVSVIISNHDTKLTRKMYANADITSFHVQRFISAKGSTRKPVKEILAVYSC